MHFSVVLVISTDNTQAQSGPYPSPYPLGPEHREDFQHDGNGGRRVGKLTTRFAETVKKTGLFGDGGGLYLKVGGGSRVPSRGW